MDSCEQYILYVRIVCEVFRLRSGMRSRRNTSDLRSPLDAVNCTYHMFSVLKICMIDSHNMYEFDLVMWLYYVNM